MVKTLREALQELVDAEDHLNDIAQGETRDFGNRNNRLNESWREAREALARPDAEKALEELVAFLDIRPADQCDWTYKVAADVTPTPEFTAWLKSRCREEAEE